MSLESDKMKEALNELGAGNIGMNSNSSTTNTHTDVRPSVSIGFGGREVFTMSTNLGSEYVNKMAQSIQEAYKQSAISAQETPKVSILDKTVITNLGYSVILIHYMYKSTINYFKVILEGTGELPKTAEQIMQEVEVTAKQTNVIPYIFTTSDAADSILDEEALRVLSTEYKGATSFKSVDGVVVPSTQHNNENIALNIAAIGFNATNIDAKLSDGEIADFNIALAKKNAPSTLLKFDSNMYKQTVQNEVDAPVRADWQIELNALAANQNISSPNMRDGKHVLTHVCGYTDAIPEEIAVPSMPGMPVTTQLRLHPHHIVTSNGTQTPTPAMMLLGIVSSLVVTNESMWLAAVMPEEGKSALHNTGVLNILTNLENNQNKIGEVLDLTSKKTTPDEAYALLKNMYSLGSVVSYDIESVGPQTYYASSLAFAAKPGNGPDKIGAASEIIDAANWLTNHVFPADYNINEIFTGTGIVVPLGKWSDKSGERDIRDIDLAFVLQHSNGDINLAHKWILSSLPKEITGLDPYLSKVEIISKLIPTAVITGKAIRVTFTEKFISTLMMAATQAGLNAIYEPVIKFAETNNLGVMNSYLAGASINNPTTGFATQQMQTGPVYYTPYAMQGAARWGNN